METIHNDGENSQKEAEGAGPTPFHARASVAQVINPQTLWVKAWSVSQCMSVPLSSHPGTFPRASARRIKQLEQRPEAPGAGWAELPVFRGGVLRWMAARRAEASGSLHMRSLSIRRSSRHQTVTPPVTSQITDGVGVRCPHGPFAGNVGRCGLLLPPAEPRFATLAADARNSPVPASIGGCTLELARGCMCCALAGDHGRPDILRDMYSVGVGSTMSAVHSGYRKSIENTEPPQTWLEPGSRPLGIINPVKGRISAAGYVFPDPWLCYLPAVC
ncbi:hypothetical protein VTN00DRAFT_4041 [Thermoascus crustaceus]|uniref:uncharacterized protein n=1 Tax=Thermoascus crustaceus TaxID=5088 RepID=UPI003743BC4D